MNKNIFISSVVTVIAFAAVITSCEKPGNNPDSPESTNLSGYVTKDLALKANTTYYLTGSLQVKAPATLSLSEGTKVVAKDNGEIIYILIEQGAKINARGTASNPVVMTCEKEESGAWGGLHICGRAHTNIDGGKGVSEIGNAPYGGNDDADNSGVIEYVRLEYTGYALDEEHEANGLSLYGVGNGTKISYVQAYKGSDDGIEFFGGSVNIDHTIVVDCTDDSFDWTEGWNGKGEYLVAYQSDASCDCLMECDNNGKNNDATPVAKPRLSKVTLVGNSSEDNKRGVRLRAGTHVILDNALISGKKYTVNVETPQTANSIVDGTSTITNVIMTGEFRNEVSTVAFDEAAFLAKGNRKVESISLKNGYVGLVDGKGAVDAASDWTKGWTR